MEYKHSAKITVFIFVTIFCLAFLAIAKGPSGGQGGGPNPSPAPVEELDYNESVHLKFMRAEEKLAHDVYKYLDNYLDPENPVYPFANIVESEANHQDSMANMLKNYGIEDDNADDPEGVWDPDYYVEEWGYNFFATKYAALTAAGEAGLCAALHVGGLIEELDMHDIVLCPEAIQVQEGIGEEDCGMYYTEEDLLEYSFGNLYAGSEDHLRAFAGAILLKCGVDCYKAQYLSQEDVNEILGVPEGTCVDGPEED